jgi:hypothetical protein
LGNCAEQIVWTCFLTGGFAFLLSLAPALELLLQLAPGLVQTGGQALQLPIQEFLVEGDQDGVRSAVDLLLSAIHLHSFQPGRGHGSELAAGDGQQIGMQRWPEPEEVVPAAEEEVRSKACSIKPGPRPYLIEETWLTG